jgi:hypothetical protein
MGARPLESERNRLAGTEPALKALLNFLLPALSIFDESPALGWADRSQDTALWAASKATSESAEG